MSRRLPRMQILCSAVFFMDVGGYCVVRPEKSAFRLHATIHVFKLACVCEYVNAVGRYVVVVCSGVRWML